MYIIPVLTVEEVSPGYMTDPYTVQLNLNLTLECVSLASTRKASNVTREIVASARTGLAN